jgi:hypothetical protein
MIFTFVASALKEAGVYPKLCHLAISLQDIKIHIIIIIYFSSSLPSSSAPPQELHLDM